MTIEVGSEEWHRRLEGFLLDPLPPSWWWLSFTDPDRPKGDQFIGVCIVSASNVVAAGVIAHALGCNPGGQIGGYPAVPEGWRPREEYVNRLFVGDQAREFAGRELSTWAEPIMA